MSKKQKKDKAARSTRQLMGIEEIKDYSFLYKLRIDFKYTPLFA